MDFPNYEMIEELYDKGIVKNLSTSPEYTNLKREYQDLFNSIKDRNLRNKIEDLDIRRHNLYTSTDKDVFKAGFSVAVKMLIEALSTNI